MSKHALVVTDPPSAAASHLQLLSSGFLHMGSPLDKLSTFESIKNIVRHRTLRCAIIAAWNADNVR